MTARLWHGDEFTALTVTDSSGSTLNVEAGPNGLSAWIAPPDGNDGHSVVVDEADAVGLSAFLTANTATPVHDHTCVEVGRLKGQVESLRRANLAFAAENARLRLDALTDEETEAAATGLDAYIRLCGSRLPDDHRIRAVAATLAARSAERAERVNA